MLFRTVELIGAAAFYRFAAHLDTAPRFASYVRQLILVSRSIHTDTADMYSVVALFATVPNLVFLDFWRIFEDKTWHQDASRNGRITELDLVSIVFPSSCGGCAAFVGVHGTNRLLSALGPSESLIVLKIDLPYFKPKLFSVNSGHDARLNIDPFLNLRAVRLWLLRSSKEHPSLQTVYGDILRSWMPTVPHRELTIEPSFASDFTGKDFADLLAETGTTVEHIFYAPEPSPNDAAKISKHPVGDLGQVVVQIYHKGADCTGRGSTCTTAYYEDDHWKDSVRKDSEGIDIHSS